MNPWGAIVGRGRDGRRALTRAVAAALADRGLRVGGFLHERLGEGDGHRGYDAVDLGSGERHPLVRVHAEPEMCDYAFDREVFARCRAWATAPEARVVFVEAGRLEARGGGHWPAALEVLGGPPRVLILSVRPAILTPVVLSLDDDPAAGLEMPCSEAEVAAFVDRVAALT